jgi:hypothetical protein
MYKKCCHQDAIYNTKHLSIRGTKMRCGLVYYKEKCLFGNDIDFNLFEKIPTRKFDYRCGHSWTETKDGKVVDWVVNHTLNISGEEKNEWTYEELKELGFEYKFYEFEDGIRKKIIKDLGCKKKKGDVDSVDYSHGFPLGSCYCVSYQHTWRNSKI